MDEEKPKTEDRIRLEKITEFLDSLSEGETRSYTEIGRAIDMHPETVHRIVGAWMTQEMYNSTKVLLKTSAWTGPDKYCWLFFDHITEINRNKHARKFFLKEGTVKDKASGFFGKFRREKK